MVTMIIRTPNENRIATEFFRNYTNTTTVSKQLYPEAGKRLGVVANLFSKLSKNDFIEDKNISRVVSRAGKIISYKIKQYRLSLNPVFFFLEEKGLKLSSDEKKRLINFFNQEGIRDFICKWHDFRVESKDSRGLIEDIICFLRCMRIDQEVMARNVFTKQLALEFLEISKIYYEFYNKKNRRNMNLVEKIDELYEFTPVLFRNDDVLWGLNVDI